MQLGIRAHDFGKLPLDELASRIAAQGLNCVQFAPTKAIAGFDSDAGRLSPGLAVHCRETFARHGIRIAVLGCYINLADPDESQLRHNLERFKAYLRHARDFGCSVVATETGSLNSDFSWNPQNHGEAAFQRVLAAVHELVDEAEKFGVFVGIEGVWRFTVHAPARLRRLLDEVGSRNLQIVFDPVNLLDTHNYDTQDTVIEESFALFGDRIGIVHLKDFTMTDGRLASVATGSEGGRLNTSLLLRLVKRHKPWVQVLLEDTNPATVAQSIAAARAAYAQA